MARILTALLLVSALLAVAQLSLAAAPSTAEEFWRAVLLDHALPDAILWNLQKDVNYQSTTKGTSAADDSANQFSRLIIYRGSSSHEPPADDSANGFSRLIIYRGSSRDGEGHSHMMNSTVFFHEEAVVVGGILSFHFPPATRAPLGFLPRDVANSIPFSTPSLPGVLAWFGVAAGSDQAADMEETLGMCEAPPIAGEAKFCAASLEALVEGAMVALGTREIMPLTSTLPRSGAPLQPYTIQAVRPVMGSRFVSCHEVDYPYTVYLCHNPGRSRLYMVDMEGARGSIVTVAVICHTDTSHWDPEHVSFKVLGTKPGGPPVCHFMPYGHIIWAKNDGCSSA